VVGGLSCSIAEVSAADASKQRLFGGKPLLLGVVDSGRDLRSDPCHQSVADAIRARLLGRGV